MMITMHEPKVIMTHAGRRANAPGRGGANGPRTTGEAEPKMPAAAAGGIADAVAGTGGGAGA